MNRDPDLFDLPEPRKLARSADPMTSKLSAIEALQFLGNHHRKIYEALYEMEDGTFYEIAEQAGMQPAAVWRRLNELERSGRIFLTGRERLGPTGRLCRVWAIVRQPHSVGAK
jgi:predicted transcriptional regulator